MYNATQANVQIYVKHLKRIAVKVSKGFWQLCVRQKISLTNSIVLLIFESIQSHNSNRRRSRYVQLKSWSLKKTF